MTTFTFYKSMLTGLLVLTTVRYSFSQTATVSQVDGLQYGVVLDDPKMKNVKVQTDITFLDDAKGRLKFDLYTPPGLASGEKRPAIIFLNAIGERSGERKVKSWGIYTSWPTLMAAHGYIGISMEADGERIQESIGGLFDFIENKGSSYNIDKNNLGVYAASANVTQSAIYLMGEKAYKGIRAAVLYYGSTPSGPYRKDLPVFFVISEGDVRPGTYNGLWEQVLKNNAPWTIKMGTAMPHAFDAFADNDDARRIVRETISFWKNYLDPVPAPLFAHSKGRDVLGLQQMNQAKAIEILKTIIDENPKDTRALAMYASFMQHSEKFVEAEAALKKILVLKPNDPETMISLAGLAYRQNHVAEGDGYVATVERSGKITRDQYANLAFNLLVADKNKEAAAYYQKAIALAPRAIDYYNLGCAYAKTNDSNNALNALEQSVRLGYNSRQQFENDPDLTSLRSDGRFKELLGKLR